MSPAMSPRKERAIYCRLVAGQSVGAVARDYLMPAGAVEKIYDHVLNGGVSRAADLVEPSRGFFTNCIRP
jgi:hypothetical protein